MATQRYSLVRGGPPRLQVEGQRWGRRWRNLTLRLDGAELGRLATGKELQTGAWFDLPDGSRLHVRQTLTVLGVELQLTRDGRPVPGSAADPANLVRSAAQCLFAIAAMSVGLGLLAELLHWKELQARGIGYGAAVEGLIFLVLGCFVWRGSRPALLAGVTLLVLDTAVSLMASPVTGRPPSGLILRVYFLALMIRGLGAMRALKRGEQGVFAET